MKKLLFIMSVAACTLGSSCNKWFDVQPTNQVDESLLYQRQSGFIDVLTGVYIKMASPALYGRELTWGFVDVIGHTYAGVGSGYQPMMAHDYTSANSEQIISDLWNEAYNAIAHLNNLLENVEQVDSSLFDPGYAEIIEGEALALRAFLHFDLLRLFAPSYKAASQAEGIPYVTGFGSVITPVLTVAAVLERMEQDLARASELLSVADPVRNGRQESGGAQGNLLADRAFRMNYYAVQSLRARVALYREDRERAASFADEVITGGFVDWTHIDQIAVTVESDRDRTFSGEQVLVLDIPNFAQYQVDRLNFSRSNSIGAFATYFNTPAINNLYPDPNDWRKLYFWNSELSGAAAQRFNTKLWQFESMPPAYARRMPLIRLPELYLIRAEALLPDDPATAIALVSEVQSRRGTAATLTAESSVELIRQTILGEYHREFVGEGLLFFTYKRLDLDQLPHMTAAFDKRSYVLPKPHEEISYR